MKIWGVLFSLFFFLPAYSYTIISDLDDTIKITHSSNVVTGAYNGVFRKKIFSGIKTYLQDTEFYRSKLFVVSASPDVLYKKVLSLFQENQLKLDGLFLRSKISGSKFQYKVALIEELMQTISDEVVFIGDDVGDDPEAYEEIRKRYPHRVLAIYIRPIKNRNFKGTRIHTTFDLAIEELWQARISLGAVLKIIEENLSDPFKELIPKFAWCPKNLSSQDSSDQDFSSQRDLLTKRLALNCK